MNILDRVIIDNNEGLANCIHQVIESCCKNNMSLEQLFTLINNKKYWVMIYENPNNPNSYKEVTFDEILKMCR